VRKYVKSSEFQNRILLHKINHYKFNCGAKLDMEGYLGLNTIILDVIENLVATENWKLKGVNDVLLATSEALIYLIDLAIDRCFKKVVFHFDSEILVKGYQR
jgi:hypothetical protein